MIYKIFLFCLILIANSLSNTIKYATYFDISIKDSIVYIPVKKINFTSDKKINYKINLKNNKLIINDSIILDYPINQIGISNTIQAEILNSLNALNRVCSMAGSKYITSNIIKEKLAKNNIIEVGSEYGLNIERIIKTGTKVFLINKPGGLYDFDNQLSKIKIPVIISSEWIENSLLGRTEWIKFFGWLVGKPRIADSIFTEVEQKYNENLKQYKTQNIHKNILWGSIFNGSAWIAGNKSFVCNMFNDIGISIINNEFEFTSSSINMEKFFMLLKKTDILIISNNLNNYEQLLSIDPRIKKMIPQKTAVYSITNEYYETSILYPDKLINEIWHIIHNNLKKETFFRKLK